jgi:hypothetical protein
MRHNLLLTPWPHQEQESSDSLTEHPPQSLSPFLWDLLMLALLSTISQVVGHTGRLVHETVVTSPPKIHPLSTGIFMLPCSVISGGVEVDG